MTTDEATELLTDKPGYFLLRLSSGQLGALTFSVCRKGKGVRHVRVSRTREGWSVLLPKEDTQLKNSGKNEGEEREFPDLDSLFLASRVPHRFKVPLAGSPLYAIQKRSDEGHSIKAP